MLNTYSASTPLSQPPSVWTDISPRAMKLIHEMQARMREVERLNMGAVTETTKARAMTANGEIIRLSRELKAALA